MFLVRSVYFNLRNILPKSGTFLPGHPVYINSTVFALAVIAKTYCVLDEDYVTYNVAGLHGLIALVMWYNVFILIYCGVCTPVE